MGAVDGGCNAGFSAGSRHLSGFAPAGYRQLYEIGNQMTKTGGGHLAIDGVHNIRDLGGFLRQSGQTTRPGRVLRGCGMDGLTEAGREGLRGLGLVRVIDLRTAAEIAANPGPFAGDPARVAVSLFEGLAPVHQLLRDDAQFDLGDRYIGALTVRVAQFADVFRLLAETAGRGPVLFHCTAGKDRTGLVAALLLALNYVPDDEIARDYAATATLGAAMMARLRARLLREGADAALIERVLRADADSMLRVLSWLHVHHGSAQGYLAAAGLGAADLERLKTLL